MIRRFLVRHNNTDHLKVWNKALILNAVRETMRIVSVLAQRLGTEMPDRTSG